MIVIPSRVKAKATVYRECIMHRNWQYQSQLALLVTTGVINRDWLY
jgi:hypothetical protein